MICSGLMLNQDERYKRAMKVLKLDCVAVSIFVMTTVISEVNYNIKSKKGV